MAKKKSAPKKLRYAFIGAGGIAGTHLNSLSKMEDVELVALSDISEEAMQRHAGNFGIPDCFTDYKEMLRKVKPDAVSVCTPNFLHAPATVAALNAGAHVMVEKPLSMTVKEGEAMVAAAKKNRRKLIIGFQKRYASHSAYLRSAVEAGKFGKVLYARCRALRRRGIPSWGVFGRKELQGGGPLIDIGVHIIEVAHYVMGSPRPVAVSGQTFTYLGDRKSKVITHNWDYKTYTVEDLAIGQVRFENGAVLSIEASFAAHIEKNEFNFTVMGEKAGGQWDPPTMFTDENGYMINSNPTALPPRGFGEMFAAKMRNFVDHCLYNKPTLAPGEDGLMVQKMLCGIYESAEKGREVKIK